MVSIKPFNNSKNTEDFSSIEWLTTQAVKEHKEGNIEEAIAFYLEAIELDKEQPAWLYGNAISLLAKANCTAESSELIKNAVKLHPQSDEVYRAISISKKADGDLQGYVTNCFKAIEINLAQPEWLYIQLADCLIVNNNPQQALKVIEKGLKIYPEAEKLEQNLQTLQVLDEDSPTTSLEQNSNNFLHAQSVIEHKNNNFDLALEYYLRAIRNDTQQPDWIYENAITLLAQSDGTQKAIELAKQAIEIHSSSGNVFKAYGLALEKNGDFLESQQNYIKAIEISSSQPDWVYYNVIEHSIEESKIEEAIAFARQGIEVYPLESQMHYILGECLTLDNEWDEAIEVFERCLKLNPDLEKARAKIDYYKAQQCKETSSLANSSKEESNFSKIAIDKKAIEILLVANEAPPIKNFLTTAPGLRVYGIAEGLLQHNYNVTVVAPVNLRPISDASSYVFCNVDDINIDYIEMKFISSYLVNKSPDICIFTNYIQYSKLSQNIKQKIYQHSGKRTKFIYDLFAPKILENLSSYGSKIDVATAIERKSEALIKSDAFCINGEKKIGYLMGWLASLNADLSKPIFVTNMCLPSSIEDRQEREYTNVTAKTRIKFLLGGHKQSWNQSHINYTDLLAKIAEKGWNIVNVGKPSFAGYSESPFADKSIVEGNHIEDYEVLDYYEYKKLLQDEIDIAIDLFSLNRERQMAMVTRSVVSLSEGKPIIHPKGTEVSIFIEKYDAGWIYEEENEIFGIIDFIAANPERINIKKANARRLYREQFSPKVAVGTLARTILKLLGSKEEDYQILEERKIKTIEKRGAFFHSSWYLRQHKLQNKLWNGEISNAYDYFIKSNRDNESAPNFLLDFILQRKHLYQKFIIGENTWSNLKKLPNSVWLKLCSIWIDIPWYINQNNLPRDPSKAVFHYFEGNNCLNTSPNRFFDEQWYTKYYEDVQEAIDLGFYVNGFHHFLVVGIENNYSPSIFFDNEFYCENNLEFSTQAQTKDYVSGFEHFMLLDKKESAIDYLTPIFDSEYYADTYSTVSNNDLQKESKTLLFDFIDRGLKKDRYGSTFHRQLYSEIEKTKVEAENKRMLKILEEINNEWAYSNISMHFLEHLIKQKQKTEQKIIENNTWLSKIITYLEIHR